MVLACDDDGVGDIGMGGEEGLDFTEFDTEAADFDLMVEAAEVFDIAIGEIAGEVAGLVEPCAGEWAEGIGDEALGGEVGAMEIARGEAGAGDVDFAGDADGSRLQEGVEDMNLQVGNGSADETGGAVEIGGGKGAIGDMDGGFGDAVHVDELRG